MKVRWTGTKPSPMQVVHDPGNARAFVFLTVLALPTVLALLVGGITAAVLVAIGTAIVLVVWRLLLLPGVMFISDIVDNVRGVPPDQYASRRRKWW